MTLLKLANELDEYNEEVMEEQPSRAIHSNEAATFGERIKGGAAIGGLTGAGKGLISGTLTGIGSGVAAETLAQRAKNKRINDELAQQ